jgi:O-antigen ligase
VEVGLLILAGLAFVSAGTAAHYKHPALLMAWEWGVNLAVFGLVSRLIQSAREQRALLAAMLASAVSLSAYAVYQYTVELPRDRKLLEDPATLRQELARMNVGIDPDDPRLARRVMEDNVFATYSHPNSFAGFLALLLPAAVGWSWTSWRQRGLGWSAVLITACTMLLLAALWLTHSRGAILGSFIAGVVVLIISLGPALLRHRAKVLGSLGLVVLGAALVLQSEQGRVGLTKAVRSLGLRTGYWAATWDMILAHPFLGVGPGNFGRHYPRYMLPTASEKVLDPHNFLLELWATMGLPALLVLLATLALLFRAIWKEGTWDRAQEATGLRASAEARSSKLEVQKLKVELPTPASSIRWEFYLGGMAGLMLGFLARIYDQTGEGILTEGALAGGRSVVWFAALAVFDLVPWSGRSFRVALATGLLALLLNLLVSGGIGQPSVAQPMWAVAALAAMRFPGHALTEAPSSWVRRVWPLPVLGGAALAYMILVYFPVTSSQGLMAQARLHYGETGDLPGWSNRIAPGLSEELTRAATAEHKLQLLLAAERYLQANILKPLQEAARADPGAAAPHVELAAWYQELWKLNARSTDPATRALEELRSAERLDPDGKDAYFQEYRLHEALANTNTDKAAAEYGRAATALEALVERDPTEARLRYQLSEVLFKAKDSVKGRAQARQALELDELSTAPERKLTSEERERIEGWLRVD